MNVQEMREYLPQIAAPYGITVTKEQAGQFQLYLELLTEWNQKMNLTAITEPEEAAVKHFLDSILLLRYMDAKEGAKLIDVGTGAGFPGVPLLIMRPDLRLTLLDSLNKRLTFLAALLDALSLHAACVHARGEEGGRKKELRQQFDFATARAVAPMNLLCEYTLPFLKIGGECLAMKGPGAREEMQAAAHAVRELGCKEAGIEEYSLPNGDARAVVRIKRDKPVPILYPRPSAKIAKSPL